MHLPLDKRLFVLYICRLIFITMDILKFNSVEEKIITIRGISAILDSDVAELYGVETREINQAKKKNAPNLAGRSPVAANFCPPQLKNQN